MQVRFLPGSNALIVQRRGHRPPKPEIKVQVLVRAPWASNSAEECLVYTQVVGGSNPSSPTAAPVVQRRGHLATNQEIGVRVPSGVPRERGGMVDPPGLDPGALEACWFDSSRSHLAVGRRWSPHAAHNRGTPVRVRILRLRPSGGTVDTLGLNPGAERREGSTPSGDTTGGGLDGKPLVWGTRVVRVRLPLARLRRSGGILVDPPE